MAQCERLSAQLVGREYRNIRCAPTAAGRALLPQMQGVVMLKPAIDGPSSDPDRFTVVKTVDVAASKRQRVDPS
jgi:hypothetical protein